MEMINKVELKLKDFSKCSLICDNDCSIGGFYDFACALKAYAFERVKAAQETENQAKQSEVVPQEAPKE
jgi:hypothetical protein